MWKRGIQVKAAKAIFGKPLAMLLVATVSATAAACGAEPSIAPSLESETPIPDASPGVTTVIRLSIPPNAIWEWLEFSGIVDEWEARHNIRVEAKDSFDQFSAFAGGHADVVLINALDVPRFGEQSEAVPAIVGKLTADRSILAVRRTSRAETLEDLVEARIAVETSLGSTQMWGLIAEALYDNLEFSMDSGDFDLVTIERASIADQVMRGDVEACICLPGFAAQFLEEGLMRALYDGRSASEIYAQDVLQSPEDLPLSLAFVVDEAWYEQNKEAVRSLLGLWQEGATKWASDSATLIREYPHLFHVREQIHVDWLVEYADMHDWIMPSVFVSEAESQRYRDLFGEMLRTGLIQDDAAVPSIYVISRSLSNDKS